MADRTHPDHDWTKDSAGPGSAVASTDDLAAAITHLKNWFARELEKLKAPPAPPPPAATIPAPVRPAPPLPKPPNA